jgi:hypothetical protein
MDQTQIEQSNKLIAEFMGFTYVNDAPEDFPHGYYTHEEGNWFTVDEFGYHLSYNWLMEVVEKIETMDYGFKICRKVVEVYIDSTKENIIYCKENSKLESLYKAVVEFIIWYNENKQNG